MDHGGIVYSLLGMSGLRASPTALGTLNFGEGAFAIPRHSAEQVFETYVRSGGNIIDSAPIYGDYAAEKAIGEFIGTDRDRFILVTKAGKLKDSTDPNSGGLSAKNIERCVKGSLAAFGTDYVDLLLIHFDDPHTPVRTWVATLNRLAQRGWIHNWGIANAPAWVMAEAGALGLERDLPMIAAQVEYSLVTRAPELELFDVAARWEATVMAWSPLVAGLRHIVVWC